MPRVQKLPRHRGATALQVYPDVRGETTGILRVAILNYTSSSAASCDVLILPPISGIYSFQDRIPGVSGRVGRIRRRENLRM